MKTLRNGFTTGSCAAAAAKAAACLLQSGKAPEIIEITLPEGMSVGFDVVDPIMENGIASCSIIKDGGDDIDATHGLMICASLSLVSGTDIVIDGGSGVGRATKPGLSVKVGEAAINPVPRKMITEAVRSVFPDKGVQVIISVPGGEDIAKKTMNPKLGVLGGISILGTRGIVRPMSEQSYQESLIPQLNVVKAAGYSSVILTPGQMGESFAINNFAFPVHSIAQTSNFVGYMLDAAADAGFARIMLWGHHGKLVKVAGGIFHTHSRIADSRAEIIAAYAASAGCSAELVRNILATVTAEAAWTMLKERGLSDVYGIIAERAAVRAYEYVREKIPVDVTMLDYDGNIVAMNKRLMEMGGVKEWQEKYI